MKKLLIILLFSFSSLLTFAQNQQGTAFSDNTNAQPDTTAPINKPLRQQMRALHLTRGQKIQIRAIRQNAKADKETILYNDSLPQEQKRMALKDLHKQTVKNINALLTDEQREKMKAIRQEMKQNKRGNNKQQQNAAMEEEIMSLPEN